MKQNRILGKTGLIETKFLLDKIILRIAKQRKQIIYGARSIEKQAGLFARSTTDYDIFDKKPKQSANILQKALDKQAGFDYFYVIPAKHKGTWKVKGTGDDNKKGTEDDESVVDYSGQFTGLPDNVKTVTKDGVKYRLLKYELQRKIAVSKDPEYKFRREKDKDDIQRIKNYLKVKSIVNG